MKKEAYRESNMYRKYFVWSSRVLNFLQIFVCKNAQLYLNNHSDFADIMFTSTGIEYEHIAHSTKFCFENKCRNV